MTIKIDYVAAQPGFGKTRAAISYMKEHIERGFDGQDVGYVIYVAPTRALLQQTFNNLRIELKGKYDFMIHLKYGDRKRAWTSNVLREIEALLNGKQTSTRNTAPFCEGSVLFVTHAAFLRLRKHAKFEQTTVIFDEARKWAQLVESVSMNAEVMELFNKLFDTVPLIVGGKEVPGFMTVHPRALPHNQLATLVPKKEASKAFRQLESMFTQLTPRFDGDIVRTRMFGTIIGEGERTSLVKIGLPSHPFRGFKKALILSADFTTSQMYHLLKWEGCTLTDTTERFMNRYSPEGYAQARSSIEARMTDLTIVPLLNSEQMPSKNQFDSGVILPKEHLAEVKHAMWRYRTNTRGLRDLVLHLRYPHRYPALLTANQARLVRRLRELKCEIDILGWMLSTCDRLLRSWWAKNVPAKNRTPWGDVLTVPGILILNNDFVEDYKEQAESLRFQMLSIGKVEGRNDFQKSNVVAFLSAVNPEPVLGRLLKALLEDYEVEEDYVVDKAIQAIGRGNIRNHTSDKKMLAIVPTYDLAKRIWKRMGSKPHLSTEVMKKLGDYTFWSLNAATKTETSDEQRREKKREQQKNSREDSTIRMLNVLMNRRARRRGLVVKSSDENRKNELLEEIAALEEQIAGLRAQRTQENHE